MRLPPPERPLHLVTMKDVPIFPAPNYLLIRTGVLDFERLTRFEFTRDDELHVLVAETAWRNNPGAFDRVGISILAEEASPRNLLDMLPAMRQRQAEYVFTPEAAPTSVIPKMAASLDVHVRLLLNPEWPESVLRDLAEHFLYSRALKAPIEPFSTISEALGGSHGSLWLQADEALGRNWFADAEGRVTLSERWAARDQFFGRIDEPLDTFSQSALWQWLADLKLRVFHDQLACSVCPHYAYCRAFWHCGLDAAGAHPACRQWKPVMEMIAGAFAEATTAGADSCQTSS